MSKEPQISFAVESIGLPSTDKFPVAQSNGSKISDTLACRMMQHNRVGNLWRNPHSASRSTLLKVNFVGSPQIDAGIAAQALEFFLCSFCNSGSARAIAGRGLRSRNPN